MLIVLTDLIALLPESCGATLWLFTVTQATIRETLHSLVELNPEHNRITALAHGVFGSIRLLPILSMRICLPDTYLFLTNS